MIVDELVTLLEFDVKGKDKAESFNIVIQKIEDSAKALVLSLTAAITSVAYFANRVSKEIADNYEWAKSVGVAVDSYQRFEHAAEIVGGSLGDIKGDLEGWVRTAKASGMTLEEVFLREAEAVEGMTAEQSHALLSARGYSETSIRMIQQGENKLQEFLAQAEVIPEAHLQAAKDYAVTWRQVTSEVSHAMNAAVASALPYIQSILKGVRDFIRTNKELFKSTITVFFKSLAIVLMAFLKPLKLVVNAIFFLIRVIDKITFGMGKYALTIGVLTAAFGALAIAITFKTLRSIASLMGALPRLISSFDSLFPILNRLIVKLATAGVEQTALNSELAISIKKWFANTVAVWANTKAMAIHTWQVLKNALAMKANLFTVKGMTFAVQNLVRNLLVGLVRAIVQVTVKIVVLTFHLARVVFLIATKLLVLIPKLVFAITAGIVRGIYSAIVAIKALNGAIILNLLKPIAVAAAALWGAMVPALTAAATAAWGFTAALLANPITWIVLAVIVAITEIVASVYLIWKYWDEIVDALETAWKWCKNFFKEIWNGAKSVYDWIVGGILKIAEFALDIGIKVLGGIKEMIVGGINDIIELINKLPGVEIDLLDADDLDFGDKKLEKLKQRFAPNGTVPVNYSGSATVPGNSYENSRSYVDQRNITINTNATSGPAIASYMRNNDMMRGGYGYAGVV